jgi:CDP-diacylglycerol---serine O-phosphatidyltransferase
MLRHVPNFLTCCNLICGCLGIVFLFEGKSIPAAYFVWAACVFDFFDGFAARLLKVSSPIGKDLDSLADMVSFGLLPAVLMFTMIKSASPNEVLPYMSFLIAVCSALRLAVFNNDKTQTDSFRGVPTPASALFLTSLPLIYGVAGNWLSEAWVLVAITVVFSLLLVSRFELFALKFKNFSWADNKVRFTFIGLAVLLILAFKIVALPLIILSYIVLALGIGLVSRSGS